MQLIDGGMFAFSAFHALKNEQPLPLTWQVPLMVAKVVEDTHDGSPCAGTASGSGSARGCPAIDRDLKSGKPPAARTSI